MGDEQVQVHPGLHNESLASLNYAKDPILKKILLRKYIEKNNVTSIKYHIQLLT